MLARRTIYHAKWLGTGVWPAARNRNAVATDLIAHRLPSALVSARSNRAEVAEWQTRRIQNPLSLRTCGFDSHLRYHELRGRKGLIDTLQDA